MTLSGHFTLKFQLSLLRTGLFTYLLYTLFTHVTGQLVWSLFIKLNQKRLFQVYDMTNGDICKRTVIRRIFEIRRTGDLS